ncbi:hypothetical protein L2E82_01805 [Cichorium intybus]|uniref:Uncharacterized protein n=1 Tax=Cichorium intybus TaxID=13427 RepID=A0ACB9H0J5_CICIN|nr:hypothetical protein L2E82_01805 [Cichorium intybus]
MTVVVAVSGGVRGFRPIKKAHLRRHSPESPERRVFEFQLSNPRSNTHAAMSLSLLQGYSSAEEEEDEQKYINSSDDEEDDDRRHEDASGDRTINNNFKKPLFDPPNPSTSSSLPSALVAFSEISGPPQFLNNSVGDSAEKDTEVQLWRHGRRINRRDKNDMPAGAVMQAKAQLTGIRDRVSSDAGTNNNNNNNNNNTQSKVPSSATGGSAKRVATATNPSAEDAADLLRMCVQCGIPKTFSNARGMVCPVCGDRPVTDADESSKKKGSMIKDKEKNKRMKGQSSHATWKSETEMQLRQQFD